MRKREREENLNQLNNTNDNTDKRRKESSPSTSSDTSPMREENSNRDLVMGMLKCSSSFSRSSEIDQILLYINTSAQNKYIANIGNVAEAFVKVLGLLDAKIKDPQSPVQFKQNDTWSDDMDVKEEMDSIFNSFRQNGCFEMAVACKFEMQGRYNQQSINGNALLEYTDREMVKSIQEAVKFRQKSVDSIKTLRVSNLGYKSSEVESGKFCNSALGLLCVVRDLRVNNNIFIPKVLKFMILDFARCAINEDKELQK